MAVLLSYGHLFIVDVRPTFTHERKVCFPLKICSFIYNIHFLRLCSYNKQKSSCFLWWWVNAAGMLPWCLFCLTWCTACLCSTVLLHNALPFVGFGFLDNCIMIVAVSQSACCSVAGLGWPAAGQPRTCFVLSSLISCTVGTFGVSEEAHSKCAKKSLFDSAKLSSPCFHI